MWIVAKYAFGVALGAQQVIVEQLAKLAACVLTAQMYRLLGSLTSLATRHRHREGMDELLAVRA